MLKAAPKIAIPSLMIIVVILMTMFSQVGAQPPITATVISSYTYVWDGPSATYAHVDTLDQDVEVTLIGRYLPWPDADYWYQVITPDQIVGWIWEPALDLPENAGDVPNATPPPTYTPTLAPTNTPDPFVTNTASPTAVTSSTR